MIQCFATIWKAKTPNASQDEERCMVSLNKIHRFMTETFQITRNIKVIYNISLLVLSLLSASAISAFAQSNTAAAQPQMVITATPPKSWIDEDTGHRVVRLTNELNSEALPSDANAYTPDGKDMVYLSPQGLHVLNLATGKTKLLVKVGIQGFVVGTRTRRVFYMQPKTIYLNAVDIDTGKITHVTNLPIAAGVLSSINADETLVVGTSIKPGGPDFLDFYTKALKEDTEEIKANPSNKNREDVKQKAMQMRLDANIPESMFTINLQTGETRTILQGTDWLSHPEFSPIDPALILYEHEGPYANASLDRVWTIRADGAENQLVHERVIPGETTAHPFWSADGKTIWYERRKPQHDNPSWSDHDLIGYDVKTKKEQVFRMDQMSVSTFFNIAPDGSFFCGSGHYSKSAHGDKPTDNQILWSGEWIQVYYPILNNKDAGVNPQQAGWFHFNNQTSDSNSGTKYAGWFRREPLVNMFKNNYSKLEPNVRVSPDNKLVIFTSDMFGPTYVFAVEVN
jgi:oligogalacturonide lyase